MKKYLLLVWVLTLGSFGASFGQFSNQNVLLEEYTGTWCQYCADGAVRVEQVLGQVQNVQAIAIHVGDVMEIPDGGTVANFYNPAFPEGMINRDGGLYSRTQWLGNCNTASQAASSASVSLDSLDYNASTRELFARVRVQFTGIENGDLRWNLAITENNVTGGSQYSQYNSDNGTPGHPYQGAGNPIVGFSHQHVLRAFLGGAWGMSSGITTPTTFGQIATYDFSYTIPSTWDENEIHVVAMLQEYGPTAADRRILNSEESSLPGLVNVDGPLTSDLDLMHIAPNPMNDISRITYSLQTDGFMKIEVIDIEGRQVALLADGWQNQGVHTYNWSGVNNQGQPVANGMYLIRIANEHGEVRTGRVMIAR